MVEKLQQQAKLESVQDLFDQVGHETIYGSSKNNDFFT